MPRADQPSLSIVVLNFNGKAVLGTCLDSVLRSEHEDFEVIIVDNASVDESPRIAEEFVRRDSRFQLVRNSSNLGFCSGYNVGAQLARGEYIALVNNDTEFPPDSFKEIISLMESDPKVGLCEGKVLLSGNKVGYPGNRFNPVATISNADMSPDEDEGQYDRVHEIFSAGGVAPVLRASVAREVGFYDPSIWWTNDIEDLSWRVRLKGYKVVFVPRAIVNHHARLGGGWYSRDIKMKVAFHSTKNQLYVLLKNGSKRTIIQSLPIIVALRTAELLYLFVNNKPDLFASKTRAHVWIARNVRHIWRERLQVQTGRKVPEREVRRLMAKIDFGLIFRHYKALMSLR